MDIADFLSLLLVCILIRRQFLLIMSEHVLGWLGVDNLDLVTQQKEI